MSLRISVILKVMVIVGKNAEIARIVVPSMMLFCNSALATDMELRVLGATFAFIVDTLKANIDLSIIYVIICK